MAASVVCHLGHLSDDLQFTVAVRVDVTVRRLVKVPAQLWSIDEISIMSKADTIRRVGKEWLSLGGLFHALCWVTQMCYSHGAWPSGVVGLANHGHGITEYSRGRCREDVKS